MCTCVEVCGCVCMVRKYAGMCRERERDCLYTAREVCGCVWREKMCGCVEGVCVCIHSGEMMYICKICVCVCVWRARKCVCAAGKCVCGMCVPVCVQQGNVCVCTKCVHVQGVETRGGSTHNSKANSPTLHCTID